MISNIYIFFYFSILIAKIIIIPIIILALIIIIIIISRWNSNPKSKNIRSSKKRLTHSSMNIKIVPYHI